MSQQYWQACLSRRGSCQGVIYWRYRLADDALLQLDPWDAVWREVVRGVICYWYAMYV
jgi:hypothetical protein